MKTIYKKLLFLLLLLPFSVLAQNTVEGVVLDAKTSQPLAGVNVVVQSTNQGTSTDLDGKFKLSKIKNGDAITFTFIGYKSETVQYSGQNSITVSLTEEANQLQEVVVQVGYGNVKKKDATGSVAVVSAKDFNKGSITNAGSLLNGRVAGVTVNTGGGSPGSGATIRIRGGSSLAGGNDPLVVIDGLPIANETAKGSTSFLASINPNDIESFSILKDASATAIYGSRASNGVILITTKKGGKKLSVDYNFQYGSGKVVDKISVLSADEFRALVQERRPGDVGLLGNANTDWQEEIYRRTDYVDNNLSIKGNLFKVIPSRLSIGNTYEEGLRLTNKFNRSTASVSLNPSFFKDHLKLRVNANYTFEKNRFADAVEGSAVRFNPTQPVYDPTSPFGGFYEYRGAGNTLADLTPNSTRNPVSQLLMTNDRGDVNRFYGSFEADYKFHFFPDLRAVVNLGFDETNGERLKLVAPNAGTSPRNGNVPYGKDEFESGTYRSKLLDAYLVYRKDIGKLNLEATGGYSYQIFQQETTNFGNINDPNLGSNFPEVDIPIDNVLIGFFARAVLNYNNKYIITANFRRDGSSRIAEQNRWLNTPGLAFAWKMKEEFFKDSNSISELKLRLGYGVTGQQNLETRFNNIYLQQYTVGSGTAQYYFGTNPTPIGISKPYNPDLRWEETTTYNAGIDFGIYKRITGSIDAFYKSSDKLFQNAPLPDGSNFSNRIVQNIGSFSTKGLELTLNFDVAKTENFNWNVNLNATKYEKRIEELALDADIFLGDTGTGTGGTAQIYREGFTPNSFYVYKQLYDTAGRPIEGAYADLNGDGIINGDDRYIYKNPDPDATFGFASNMNYKSFDFSFNVRASVGNRIYNAVNATRAQYDLLRDGTVLGNLPTSISDTNFNTTADVVLSDLYIENGSYLKLDNVTLGYTFKKWLEGKASLRLFAGMQNVFTITEYSGLDPEITNEGRDNTIYPRQRQVLVGANVKF